MSVDDIPVIEVFGPTIQGEGALAGLPTHFVRIGYCDYRCSWCDSMYAVEPELVAKHGERLSPQEIIHALYDLDGSARWVTLSGGNPAIHDLEPLRLALAQERFKVAVETQGSYWRDWLSLVDMLTVSPKPPSSGMATPEHIAQTHEFMARAEVEVGDRRRCLKIVVFDEFDLAWAKLFLKGYDWDAYLSVGTDRPAAEETDDEARRLICERTRWLYEATAGDSELVDVRILPQLHVLAWGHARGV